MKKPVTLTFAKPPKPPTKAELLAGKLLAIQIEQLEKSPTLRKATAISLKDLERVDKIRKQLQGLSR